MSRSFEYTTMMVDRDGVDIEINIEGWVYYHVDTDYRADADGKRGERHTFIDEVTEIDATDMDDMPFEITDKEKEIAADILGNKFLEG